MPPRNTHPKCPVNTQRLVSNSPPTHEVPQGKAIPSVWLATVTELPVNSHPENCPNGVPAHGASRRALRNRLQPRGSLRLGSEVPGLQRHLRVNPIGRIPVGRPPHPPRNDPRQSGRHCTTAPPVVPSSSFLCPHLSEYRTARDLLLSTR